MTVSTNLGPWVNRRGIFDRHTRNDVFRDAKLASAQRWGMSPKGQHIELGIAEQNLFLLLGAAGLAPAMTGARLLPVGTVYDPFVNRGLDALIYACYQDARFLLVSHAVGPDAGAGGRAAPVDQHAADRHGRRPAGELRAGACGRAGDPAAPRLRPHAASRTARRCGCACPPAQLRAAGAHARPGGGDRRRALGRAAGARARASPIAYQGPVAPEAEAAFAELREEEPGAGLLAITSPDRLHAGWIAALRARRAAATGARVSHIERMLAPLAPGAALVTVLDGHPATHAWLGAVRGQRVVPLGPDRFGQSGDIPDLYREYGIDTDAILDACAQALLA